MREAYNHALLPALILAGSLGACETVQSARPAPVPAAALPDAESVAKLLSLADSGLLHQATSAQSRAAYCSPYTKSENYVRRQNSITTSPDQNWAAIIENAAPDTEILLLDGNYRLNRHTVVVSDNTTIRSASENRGSVTISGRGYSKGGEGFMLTGNDITIADLSVTAMRDHAISIKPLDGAQNRTQIYNVHLYDIGTQHIKLNVGGSDDGLIACSSIGYTDGGAKGDYNGAIDLHQAKNWVVRDNTIYNIRGDGSGCNVDSNCGTFTSAPAILAWNQSLNTHVLRNRIFDSYRNIALGLGRGHHRGVISDNLIVQTAPGDAGIELQTVSDTLVENNTVILSGNYPGAIEYRDTENITIRANNLTSKPFDRGDNREVTLHNNTVDRHLQNKL